MLRQRRSSLDVRSGSILLKKSKIEPQLKSRESLFSAVSTAAMLGWVCENHPDRPWDDELGCTCGAGTPCKCNMAGGPAVDEPDISQVIIEDRLTRPV
jgi:hypothetical protein